MTTKKPKGDYEVGYGKPPKHTQFKKGQSGNPRGRPKASKNLATVVHDLLHEKVTVRIDNKPKKMTKWEAIVQMMMLRAMNGDPKAVNGLLTITRNTGHLRPEEQTRQGGVMLIPKAPETVEEWEAMFGQPLENYECKTQSQNSDPKMD